MKVVIAPDKFKDCLPAEAVAAHLAAGVRKAAPHAIIDICPVGDGGEGTVAALVAGSGGQVIVSRVTGPRVDMKVDAAWGLLDDGKTAVIEMSAASGLALLKPQDRDPRMTTTFGTGELLLEAVHRGAERIVLGIGGSATMDAGVGCCQAVGHTVLRKDGEPVDQEPVTGGQLADILMVKKGRGSPLDRVRIEVACDVRNPLCGTGGAARVFGPQKGAGPATVDWFEEQHRQLAQRCLKETEAGTPGAGAAGGLGWAMVSFFNAALVPGIDLVLEVSRFRSRLAGADWCLTGEGRFDASSLAGKAPTGVARACHELGVKCVLVAGRIEIDPGTLFAASNELSPREGDWRAGIEQRLEAAAEQMVR